MAWPRFKTLIENKRAVPIHILQKPRFRGKHLLQRGILLCGHKVVDNLIETHGKNFKKCWFIISDSQSNVFGDSPEADIQMFSDKKLINAYKRSCAKHVPHLILGDGHFVDPKIFYPEPRAPKVYDVIYIAKWFPTKRIELFVEALEYLPKRRGLLLAFYVLAKKNKFVSYQYANRIKALIKERNLDISVMTAPEGEHTNPDGSYVPGGFGKEKIRKFINQAKISMLTADINEAINRAICESLCCNLPIVVTRDTLGGVTELVTPKTGTLASPNGRSIAQGIERILDLYSSFEPRKYFTSRYGTSKATSLLKNKILSVLAKKGEILELSDFEYRGDLWTKDYYNLVLPINYSSIESKNSLRYP